MFEDKCLLITGGTGACVNPNADPNSSNYWDLGVRGDTSRTGGSGFRLGLTYSIITDAGDYSGTGNSGRW